MRPKALDSALLPGFVPKEIRKLSMRRSGAIHLIVVLSISSFVAASTYWLLTQADPCRWEGCADEVLDMELPLNALMLNESTGVGMESRDLSVDEREVVNRRTWKNVGVVHSVVGHACRRNTGILIQRMRSTQRKISEMLYKHVPDMKKRFEAFPDFFGPAMNGFRYALRMFKYYSQDEYKFFLEFADPTSNCNHITIGVGGSWDGEKALRRKYPQCRLTGIDPVVELSQKVVEADPHSRFIHAAISDGDAKANGWIKGADGIYESKPTETVSLSHILMTKNEGRTVDFMTIDIEGAEFPLFRVLHRQRNLLPTICQINIEIHYANESYGVKWAEVDRILREMMDEGHYILLNVETRFTYNQIFLLNVGDDECIQKFLC